MKRLTGSEVLVPGTLTTAFGFSSVGLATNDTRPLSFFSKFTFKVEESTDAWTGGLGVGLETDAATCFKLKTGSAGFAGSGSFVTFGTVVAPDGRTKALTEEVGGGVGVDAGDGFTFSASTGLVFTAIAAFILLLILSVTFDLCDRTPGRCRTVDPKLHNGLILKKRMAIRY